MQGKHCQTNFELEMQELQNPFGISYDDCRSKLCVNLFSVELARRLEATGRYLGKHFIRTKWQYFVCRSECVHRQPWPEQHGSEALCERYKRPGDGNIPLLVLLASAQDSGQRSSGGWHHCHHVTMYVSTTILDHHILRGGRVPQ